MPFPFTISYHKPLRVIVTSDNQQQIVEYIKDSILKGKAHNIVVDNTLVSYQGSTSYSRASLFGSVDRGTFRLDHIGNRWFLVYEIRMYLQSVLATVVAILGGFWSKFWWIGVMLFLLYILIWFMTISRHQLLVSTIASNIDELVRVQMKNTESTDMGEVTLR